jgi:hypothetical protein
MADIDLYALARRALLDALDALGPQRKAVILCGAQAIYLHIGEADFAVSPYTTDADLMLTPGRLSRDPPLAAVLEEAGFRSTSQPGIWHSRDGIEVDLLVPEALGGGGRRGARLGPPHGDRVARKVRGLEGVLADNAIMQIGSLEPGDHRRFKIAVAGPAALLVAKLHKIAERSEVRVSRLGDKDALDALRILRAVPTDALANTIVTLRTTSLSREVTLQAMEILRTYFAQETATGTQMAVRATEGLEDPAFVAASCTALASDLLTVVQS